MPFNPTVPPPPVSVNYTASFNQPMQHMVKPNVQRQQVRCVVLRNTGRCYDLQPPLAEHRMRHGVLERRHSRRDEPTPNMVKWNRVRAPSPDLTGFGDLDHVTIDPSLCYQREAMPTNVPHNYLSESKFAIYLNAVFR